ncbi:hypothetical protein Adu01nite_32380 [Paractinoplanes durhamensis]|uniref:WD40 repeat domain-containing protein n=1 Tax=Paractinoplanes durhamensis TaxID=113563 RepID=A0ABQ3YWD6_9ACTN|nr:hypothetical protein Adu01nite_32380 [Actinoplanes durhamensis]
MDDPRFVERPWLSEALTGPLHDENCRFVLLTGEPGAGKTGIVARLARTNPSWLRYFIRWDSITPLASGDARSLLLAAGHQLAVRRPELFAGQGPDIRVEQQADEVAESGQMVGISIDEVSVSPFRKVAFSVKQKAGTASGEIVGLRIRSLNLEPRLLDLATLCEMALSEPGRAAAGEPIVVLVDAVDDRDANAGVQPENTILSWLSTAADLPPNVKFVITCRAGGPAVRQFRRARAAELAEVAFGVNADRVQDDLLAYTRAALPGRPSLERRLVAKADGNILYLAMLFRQLDLLRSESAEDYLTRTLDSIPNGLRPLYAFFIGRTRAMVEDVMVPVPPGFTPAWPALCRPVLGMLAIAQASVSAATIRSLAGLPFEPHWVEQALEWLAPYLERSESGYRLYHGSLGDFVVSAETARDHPDCYLDSDRLNGELVDRTVRAYGLARRWLAAPPYVRQFMATHAVRSSRLGTLVGDPLYLVAAQPDRLLAATSRSAEPAVRPYAKIYRTAVSWMRNQPAEVAGAYLAMHAQRLGENGFADVLARTIDLAWRQLWTYWRTPGGYAVLGSHRSDITAVTLLTSDGRDLIVSGDAAGVQRVWDPIAGEPAAPPRQSACTPIRCMTSLPGVPSGVIIAGGDTNEIEVWDVGADEATIHRLDGDAGVSALRAVRIGDATLIAAGRHNGDLLVLDAATMRPVAEPFHAQRTVVISVDLTLLDGNLVTVSTGTFGMKVHDVRTGADLERDVDLDEPLWSVATIGGPGSTHIAYDAGVGHFGIWDIATRSLVLGPLGAHPGGLTTMVAGPEPGTLVTGGFDNAVRVWEISSGRRLRNLEGHSSAVTGVCAGLAAGRPVVGSVSRDRTVRVWLDVGGEDDDQLSRVVGTSAVTIWHAGTDVYLIHAEAGDIVVRSLADGHGAHVLTDALGTDGIDPFPKIADDAIGGRAGGYMMITRSFGMAGGTYFDVDELRVGTVLGRSVLAAADYNFIVMFDLETGLRFGRALAGFTDFAAMCFLYQQDSRDDDDSHTIVACIDKGGLVWLWDAASGRPLMRAANAGLGRVEAAQFFAFSGRTLLVTATREMIEFHAPFDDLPPPPQPAVPFAGAVSVAARDFAGRILVAAQGKDWSISIFENGLQTLSIDLGTEATSMQFTERELLLVGTDRGVAVLDVRFFDDGGVYDDET